MKKIVFLLLFALPLPGLAQDTGIHFLHAASWEEVQAKAKAASKYIFMDCLTTWCGPCKYMSNTVFPLDNVGEFMNDKFVSIKVQLDTTKNDNELVKGWYKDAHDIAQKYKVRAYPTYLVFDADGNVLHRFVGSSPANEFLASVAKSLNPKTQYYTLLNQYKAGSRESQFLHDLAIASMNAYDLENAQKISNEYLSTQDDFYTKDNLEFIKMFTHSSSDMGFEIIRKEPAEVDAALGEGTAASLMQPIIWREEVYPNLPADGKADPDWEKLKSGIAKKYPGFEDETIAKAKVGWYQSTRNWDKYQSAIVDYMKRYGAAASPGQLNSYAWTVFENCPDMKCVEQALEWSKRSFADNNNPMFIDTYANILYKLGKKEEALQWEKKALDLASDADKKGYEATLNKMRNNEKTWN